MIRELIAQGESKTVEIKRDVPKNHQIAQTICAFANRAGGILMIGVSDDGNVVGMQPERIHELIEKVPNILHDAIFPMILPEIYTYTMDQKMILIFQVFPGSNTPYYVKNKGKANGTYIRVGRTNKQADEEMIKELERHKLNISFDMDVHEELMETDVSRLIATLNNEFQARVTKEKIENLKLINRFGDREYLTNAGAIILGKKDNSTIRCGKFLGESIIDFSDKKEYSGNIFELLEKTIAFIKNHLSYSGILQGSGLKRKDILEIPEEVLREGVINALIHRDYSILGADIKIAIFDSKIEITSPGGLPKSLTAEEIYNGRSEIRNRILSNIFLKAGYVEQWGSGIPRMREICKNQGLKEPEIEEKGLFVVLRIFRKKRMTMKTGKTLYENTKTKTMVVREEQEEVLSLIQQNNELTVREIAETIEVTESSVQRRLKSLQELGKIERIGSKKTGHWKVKNKDTDS